MNVLLIFLLLFSTMNGLDTATEVKGYEPGDIATDFRLKNIDGTMVSLADFEESKGFIVIFSCNHCPFVVAYEDRIVALNKKYASKGYPVIAVNPNDPEIQPADSYEQMQIRAKEKGFNFPYLVDETQDVARTYGAVRTPQVYLLQKNEKGQLVVQYVGAIDDNTYTPEKVKTRYVEEAVEDLLNNRKPKNNFTKAIGCTIKWRKS